MLARTFLSAEALGLTESERHALIGVLGILERGEAKHTPIVEGGSSRMGSQFTGHFNMKYFNRTQDCRTVCCIGGLADLLFGEKFVTSGSNRPNLYEVFYPSGICKQYERISVTEAAHALSNYLTTGHANWKEACNGS